MIYPCLRERGMSPVRSAVSRVHALASGYSIASDEVQWVSCGDRIKSGLGQRVAEPDQGVVGARLCPICDDTPSGPIEALRGTLILFVSL